MLRCADNENLQLTVTYDRARRW